MIRKTITEKKLGRRNDFRWRGGDISRVEGFSDAVFAFAVTLLVVSLEVPKSFEELISTISGFLAFGICFTFLIWIWYSHYIFFRRYGFEDTYTTVLNAVLLFVVLFYIYPLKFLFTFLINKFTGWQSSGIHFVSIAESQIPLLMIIYSIGFFAVFSIFFLMYLYAYRKREELDLNDIEISLTKFNLEAYLIYLSVAVFSLLIIIIGGAGFSFWSGTIYALIGPLRTVHGILNRKKFNRLKLQLSATESASV